MLETFESSNSRRSPIIFILAFTSSQSDKNLKMRTKIWGRKNCELLPLTLCLSCWLCLCMTCITVTRVLLLSRAFYKSMMSITNTYLTGKRKLPALKTSMRQRHIFIGSWKDLVFYITCFGLAPPRRTSKKVAQRTSVWGNRNSLSDIAEKMGCVSP